MTTDLQTRTSAINWRIIGWGGAVALLALPFVAMQFTTEVNWTASDFVIMGVLIAMIGLGIEFVIRRSGNALYRLGGVVALLTAFLTIWVNMAVGMIGDDNPYNLVFLGVIVIGLGGSAIAGFRPAGTTRAMLVAAVAQAIASLVAINIDPRGAVLSALFALPWLVAAGLSWRSARA